MEEFVLQARLKYVAFKRCIWFFETLLLLVLFLVVEIAHVENPWYWTVLVAQSLRVLTEALNHVALAQYHQISDWFPLIYPVH